MDSSTTTTMAEEEVVLDIPPMLRVYKSGRIERLMGTEIVPPSLDSKTNVQSKDIVFSTQHNLSLRLYYLPDKTHKRLPLLLYFHGGGFAIETPFSPTSHNYLNTLVSETGIIAVSVDYRRAPEHSVPAAYDDSWTSLKWVASHFNQNGPEDLINQFADLNRVFLSGDSAGGNIAHFVAMKQGGEEKIDGINIQGMVLCHPFFWGSDVLPGEKIDSHVREEIGRLWKWVCPVSSGVDDPWLNPGMVQNLSRIGCGRIMVIVSEKDKLRERGGFMLRS